MKKFLLFTLTFVILIGAVACQTETPLTFVPTPLPTLPPLLPTTLPAPPTSATTQKTVTIMGPFRGEEEERFNQALAEFMRENPDIAIKYTGTEEFETLINNLVDTGVPPDIAAIPQPGLMKKFAATGKLAPLPASLIAKIESNYSPAWKDLGSFNGNVYGLYHRVNAKGWVWYNKPAFEQAGYLVPQTWDELQTLTRAMETTGTAPWCIGIESGAATGWVGTDWLENIMLRTQPVEVYDQWVDGKIKFSSEPVRSAWKIMDSIWNNPKQVNGARPAILRTEFKQSAQDLFARTPQCWLHMQGSFVTGFFPEAVQNDLDNQVGVFLLPPIDPALPKALEVGGDQYVVFAGHARPEVLKVMEYLTSGKSASSWIQAGGALFPHRDQDISLYKSKLDQTLVRSILEAQAARFDASDLMPPAVNAAFWKAVTDYVGGKSIEQVTAEADASWE